MDIEYNQQSDSVNSPLLQKKRSYKKWIFFGVIVILLVVNGIFWTSSKNTTNFLNNAEKDENFKQQLKHLGLDIQPVKRARWDKRKFKHMKLDNDLNLLMISRPDFKMSGVALTIEAGSYQDTYPGIAHMLEHSVFLASQKYKDGELIFNQCMQKYQGGYNAATGGHSTTYYFTVTSKGFAECLDIFAHFFIDPSLDEKQVVEELSAVDSEYRKDLSLSGWKDQFIEQVSMNKNSEFSKFSIGNYETLGKYIKGNGTTLSHELRSFFNKYYSSNLMTVVIQTPDSIDTIEKLAVERFSKIGNSKIKAPNYDDVEPAFTQSQMEKMIIYERSTSMYTLSFILDKDYYYEEFKHPFTLICSVFKYGKPDSLKNYLKKHGYILAFGCSDGSIGQGKLKIKAIPTKYGLENYQELTKIIFAYIKKVKEQFNFKEYYDDMKKVYNMNYKFSDPPSSLNKDNGKFAQYYNNFLKKVVPDQPEFIFSFGNVYYQYNESLIQDILSQLTLENSIIYLGSPDYTPKKQTNSNGQSYKTDERLKLTYQIIPYQNSFKQQILDTSSKSSKCILPNRIKNIPTKFDMLTSCQINDDKCKTQEKQNDHKKVPLLIEHNSLYKLFVKTERFYNSPEIISTIYLTTENANTLTKQFYRQILKQCLMKKLRNDMYDQSLAGFSVKVKQTFAGLGIVLNDYSQYFFNNTQDVLQMITTYIPSEYEFNKSIKVLKYKYQQLLESPEYKQLPYILKRVLIKGSQGIKEQINNLEKLNYTQFKAYRKQFFNQSYVRAYFTGNLYADDAKSLVDNFIKRQLNNSRVSEDKLYHSQVLNLTNVSSTKPMAAVLRIRDLNNQSQNHLTYNVYLRGKYNHRDYASFLLLKTFLQNSAMRNLRTKQQLGYIVSASVGNYGAYLFAYVAVQGNKKTPDQVDILIEQHLKNSVKELEVLDLEQYKKSMISKLETEIQSLTNQASIESATIQDKQEDFHKIQRLIKIMKNITQEDLITFYKDIFKNNVKKLSLQMYNSEVKIPTTLPKKEDLYGNIDSKLFTSFDELHKIGYLESIVIGQEGKEGKE